MLEHVGAVAAPFGSCDSSLEADGVTNDPERRDGRGRGRGDAAPRIPDPYLCVLYDLHAGRPMDRRKPSANRASRQHSCAGLQPLRSSKWAITKRTSQSTLSFSSWAKEAAVAIRGTDAFVGEGCLTGQLKRLATASAMTECVTNLSVSP
jgi:hypothetical protein